MTDQRSNSAFLINNSFTLFFYVPRKYKFRSSMINFSLQTRMMNVYYNENQITDVLPRNNTPENGNKTGENDIYDQIILIILIAQRKQIGKRTPFVYLYVK